jgi:putative membrane protein
MLKRSHIQTAVCSLLLVACAKSTSPESETASDVPDTTAMNTPPPSVEPSAAEQQTNPLASDTPGTSGDIGMQQPSASPVSPMPTTPATTAATPAETLTDDQIVKIAETINTGEVEQAKLAQKTSKNGKVKKYAQHMIQEHNKASKKTATVAKKAQIKPADSPTAQNLSDKASRTKETLATTDKADFDKRYIDAQVEQHESVVLLIDSKLLPNASNPDLKARLEEAKKMVEEHLAEAKEIQSNLATASAEQTPASPTTEGR